MASLPKLFTNQVSGNAYKVRLLAALMQIQLEEHNVDFAANEHQSADFVAVNPRSSIPALVHNGRTFTDSTGILTYLAGTYPDPNTGQTPSSYWSSDAAEQAEIVDWLAFASSWVLYGFAIARGMVSFDGQYAGLGATGTPQTLADAQARADKALNILQQHLQSHDWLANGRPTIAECAVFPYVALAPMGDISLEPYPAVTAWIQRVKNLPSFIPMKGQEDPMYPRRDRAG